MNRKAKLIACFAILAVVGLVFVTMVREARHLKSVDEAIVRPVAVAGGGTMYAWGKDTEDEIPNTPLPDVTTVTAGEIHGVYIDSLHKAYAWGGNEIHQINESEDQKIAIPQPLLIPDSVTSVSSSYRHTLALTNKGDVYAWGSNFTGQLGNGTNTGEKTPTLVAGLPKIAEVAAGYKFSLALDEKGEVYGWGAKCAPAGDRILFDFAKTIAQSSTYYEPNVSTRIVSSANADCLNEQIVGILSLIPKKIDRATDIIQITAGYGHGVLLKKDGTVWTFGCNWYGQLGNRGTSNELKNYVLQKVDALSNIVYIAAGFRHSLALDANGTVYEWGGRVLADGTVERSTEIRTITGLPKIIRVYAGKDYSLAQTENGDLYGWGSNKSHMLSSAKTEVEITPVKIDVPPVAQVATGDGFIFAIVKK